MLPSPTLQPQQGTTGDQNNIIDQTMAITTRTTQSCRVVIAGSELARVSSPTEDQSSPGSGTPTPAVAATNPQTCNSKSPRPAATITRLRMDKPRHWLGQQKRQRKTRDPHDPDRTVVPSNSNQRCKGVRSSRDSPHHCQEEPCFTIWMQTGACYTSGASQFALAYAIV